MRRKIMKIKNKINLKDLEKVGFVKYPYGYKLEGNTEGQWTKLIATVNKDTRNIWIADGEEKNITKLLEEMIDYEEN